MISMVLKELLKHVFPLFAYWLFYSEAAVALLISGFIFEATRYQPLADNLLGLAAAISYFGFCIVGAASYRRQRRQARSEPWAPSWLERICAVVMNLGLIALAFLTIDLVRFIWTDLQGDIFTGDGFGAVFITGILIALPFISLWSLYRLARGRWVLMP